MTRVVVSKAPAKINLCLNVLNKRFDGYHNIQTLFQRIDLFDIIYMYKVKPDEIRVKCDSLNLACDETNLAYQAAALLKSKFSIKNGVHIRIKKRIPIAAGLGGGSSDAASVLKEMNYLFGLRLSREKLMKLGEKIGADVPFFLSNTSFAWADRKGEKIIPLDITHKFTYILVVPQINVLTKEIYKAWDKLRKCLTKDMFSAKIYISALRKKDTHWLARNCFNSLERVVIERFEEVYRIKKYLQAIGLELVLMSGSGPSIFGMVSSRKEAADLCKKLRTKYHDCQTFVVRTY